MLLLERDYVDENNNQRVFPLRLTHLFSIYTHNTFPLHTLIFTDASVCLPIISRLRFLRFSITHFIF